MSLPQSDTLKTEKLGKVFTHTTATYKFFWFLSILQILVKRNSLRISMWDIVIRMVANAWYPIHYFRISFGKSDSLFDIVTNLQRITKIPIDADKDTIAGILKERANEKLIRDLLVILTQNVPYRFLSPWIRYTSDNNIIIRSQVYENQCLYSLHKKDGELSHIVINASWQEYLQKHYVILVDFTYWNLATFLQARNPNVPAIPSKLIRPKTRNPLTKQHEYWDMVMELGEPIHCIYTDIELHPKAYDLDHFVPWSFLTHDLLWNLVPSDSSINSSKNDRLPQMEIYLPKLADLQQRSLKVVLKAGAAPKILEDYISLGYTPQQLADMSKGAFRTVFEKVFNPLNQIALNMGFETWKY